MSESIGDSVKRAVLWRSGSQMLAQIVAWGSTLAVIRILDPADYGLFAMTQVVLAFLSFLNGYGFASSLVQDRAIDERKIRQAFGMMLLVNVAIALIQLALAPLAAAYFRHPAVADLLRVQALIVLATPFIAVPEALLMRKLDFRRQAIVNLIATVTSAAVALGCALSGLGVWTLVYAPMAMFWTRGIGLMIAARFKYWPSFRFTGAGSMFAFGMTLLASNLFWTIITQADTFIAARRLSLHDLGIYAEALFLTTIVTTKFVPPLNEVAFPAYARMQDDKAQLAAAFLKAVRLILLITCPLYFGLAVVAPDAVSLVLGEKWLAMSGLVTVLACAMPAWTLHILFSPALSAVGHPRIIMRSSLFGALVMPPAFLFGLQWGTIGLAYAWLIAFPLLPLFTFLHARGKLGIDARQLAAAVAPGLFTSMAMALLVLVAGRELAGLPSWLRLGASIAFGGAAYAGLLYLFARTTLFEMIALVRRRRPPPAAAAAA